MMTMFLLGHYIYIQYGHLEIKIKQTNVANTMQVHTDILIKMVSTEGKLSDLESYAGYQPL